MLVGFSNGNCRRKKNVYGGNDLALWMTNLSISFACDHFSSPTVMEWQKVIRLNLANGVVAWGPIYNNNKKCF